MRWLEGWMGTVAGVIGLLVTFVASLSSRQSLNMADIYASYRGPGGALPIGAQWMRLLTGLPSITLTLLFAGVLWGVWLDLSGQRTRGRICLLTCATLILVVAALPATFASILLVAPALPFGLLALGAGLIACLRREQPTAAD